MPLADSEGFWYHQKWVTRYRFEVALFVALALVAAVGSLNLWLSSHPFWAINAALIAIGLLYAAHGSLKESRWHAARRNLHAAAADSEEGA